MATSVCSYIILHVRVHVIERIAYMILVVIKSQKRL